MRVELRCSTSSLDEGSRAQLERRLYRPLRRAIGVLQTVTVQLQPLGHEPDRGLTCCVRCRLAGGANIYVGVSGLDRRAVIDEAGRRLERLLARHLPTHPEARRPPLATPPAFTRAAPTSALAH